ncbi:MAG: hypothetical protein DRH04_11600, partial [Deltaproteobacteria bacterium]
MGSASFFGSSPDYTYNEESSFDGFGSALAWIDINSDGSDDLFIGAVNATSSNGGKVYVYHGGPSGLATTATTTVTGRSSSTAVDKMGRWISGADVNGDGTMDAIITCDRENISTNDNDGRVYVYLGGSSGMSTTPFATIDGRPGEGSGFGFRAVSAGDVNNDGYEDIVVSAPDAGTMSNGELDLFLGSPTGISSYVANTTGQAGEGLGKSMDPATDFDGDGGYELLVGGPELNFLTGGAHIYDMVINMPKDVALDIGDDGSSEYTGNGDLGDVSIDITDALNVYLSSPGSTTNDSYGNEMVAVPVKVTTASPGKVRIYNLSIEYTYAPMINITSSVKSYISQHKDQADSQGMVTYPIKLSSGSAGKLTVSGINIRYALPPVLKAQIPDLNMSEDSIADNLLDLSQYFEDDDSVSNLVFTIETVGSGPAPVNVTIEGTILRADASTGPENDNWTGDVDLRITATDQDQLSVQSNVFTLSVLNVNDKPVITSTPITEVNVGESYTYQVEAVDGDQDILTYSLVLAPQGMEMDSTGLITWIPGYRYIGEVSVTLQVSDPYGESAIQTYTVAVQGDTAADNAPELEPVPDRTITKGENFTYTLHATDMDPFDVLTYSLENAPSGMTVNETSGELSWTPQTLGRFTITAVASDGLLESKENFTLTVKNNPDDNRAPEITSEPEVTEIIAGEADYTYQVTATDPDEGTVLTYELSQGPPGMTVDRDTGLLVWNATLQSAGEYSVVIKVSDLVGASDTQEFTLMVKESSSGCYLVVLLLSPQPKDLTGKDLPLKGEVTLKGTVTDAGCAGETKVQVRIDGGDWKDAEVKTGALGV